MQGCERHAENQKKTCEVISFIQANRMQRVPETQQDDHEDGSQCKFGKPTEPSEGIFCSRFLFGGLFLSRDLAEERTGQQEQSRESRQSAVKSAKRWHSGCSFEVQCPCCPALEHADGGAAEDQACMRGAADDLVLGHVVPRGSHQVPS